MAIFKINKSKDYTTISNFHLRDNNLSLKAKGLLSMMFSLPSNWDYSVRGLEKICKESKNTINEILHELESNNYLIRKRIYTNGKISDWEYNIFEKNDLHPKNQDIENQDIGFWDNNKYTKELNNNSSNNINNDINNKLYNNIYNYIEENFGRTLNPIEYELVSSWKDNELTRYAIKQAILNGKYNLKYINTILKNWELNRITTIQEAQEEEIKFKNRNEKEKIMTSREKRDLEFEELLKTYKED